jgi:hypothetical protein
MEIGLVRLHKNGKIVISFIFGTKSVCALAMCGGSMTLKSGSLRFASCNTTPLLLARVTPMSILIPVSAQLTICVYMMCVFNDVGVGM